MATETAEAAEPEPPALGHRWSGWPGAWCLDCGIEDPIEIAMADRNYVVVLDDSEMGFHYEFPGVTLTECKEPGSRRFDPYRRGAENDCAEKKD